MTDSSLPFTTSVFQTQTTFTSWQHPTLPPTGQDQQPESYHTTLPHTNDHQQPRPISMASNTTTKTTPIKIKCADRGCTTGQEIDSENNNGRKVVSDFFGRNKKQTKTIPFQVWHLRCRMSYQQGRYRTQDKKCTAQENAKKLCMYYVDHLKAQLDRLHIWRPEAKYDIQLQAPAKKRLNTYHTIVDRGASTDEAKQQVVVIPKTSKRNDKPKALSEADAVSMDHAEYIDTNFSGLDKTHAFITGTILPWIEQEIESRAMSQLPPIEFLIQPQAEDEPHTAPATNYARWVALSDGKPFVEPTASPPKHEKTPSPDRPPVKLIIKKARSPTASDSSSKASSRPEDLPLWQPPPASAAKALKKKSKIRQLSVDTALANAAAGGAPHQKPASDDDEEIQSEPGSGMTVVSGTPVMAKGMVFAAGKAKFVPRKRVIDEDYDVPEDGSDDDNEVEKSPVSKKRKLA